MLGEGRVRQPHEVNAFRPGRQRRRDAEPVPKVLELGPVSRRVAPAAVQLDKAAREPAPRGVRAVDIDGDWTGRSPRPASGSRGSLVAVPATRIGSGGPVWVRWPLEWAVEAQRSRVTEDEE